MHGGARLRAPAPIHLTLKVRRGTRPKMVRPKEINKEVSLFSMVRGLFHISRACNFDP